MNTMLAAAAGARFRMPTGASVAPSQPRTMTNSVCRPHAGVARPVHRHVHAQPKWTVYTVTPPLPPSGTATLHQRHAHPANFLLPKTLAWLATLPETVRSDSLASSYPRLANCLAASWHDAVSLNSMFSDLLVDRRHGRRGFPSAVHADLLGLWQHSWDLPR